MDNRYKRSRMLLERAMQVTPGAAQTLSKMPARFPRGAFPFACVAGTGALVSDLDQNRYVDWIGALGAIPLGYDHPKVSAAVRQQIQLGTCFSLPTAMETSLAEQLCEKIPCAEMVRFVNSGSEATEAAIRTARIATGRDVILTVKDGYHSWHSWFQAVKDWHPGIPAAYNAIVDCFAYNDLDSLGDALTRHRGAVAAIIMEPCLFEEPHDDFLFFVKKMCRQAGALLIFDEMVTGFRWHLAGGQGYFDVIPDLATYGKGMANGYPIGMLCGKRKYMQYAELISGTFGGNAVSLAAADAVLSVYEHEPIIERMWKRGKEFKEYFNQQVALMQLEKFAICDGYPVKPRIRFMCTHETTGDILVNNLAMSLFLQVTAEHGVLLHPGSLNICAMLSGIDMAVTKQSIRKGLAAVRYAIMNNDWSALKGDIITPVLTVRR